MTVALILACAADVPREIAPGDKEATADTEPTSGLAYIPGGLLQMGDHSGAGYPDERPVHPVPVSGFFMDRTEVTWALWQEVYAWALTAGYVFNNAGLIDRPPAADHPVSNVTWYDAVKWANARSEMTGRKPVYYIDPSHSTVYRAGEHRIPSAAVDWEADGFRLPTEAEWEWAARGGLQSQHYPWPSPGKSFEPLIDGSRANYWKSGDPYDDAPVCASTPVAYYRGDQQPPGADMANGYGLYDMAGNAAEWCWDWYDDQWYPNRKRAYPTRAVLRTVRAE